MKSILSFLFDVLELFLNFKMTPHLSKLIKVIQIFTIEKGSKILIAFFIIFWMFSSISKKAHSHKVPPFDVLHHI